jgi:NADH-quinone oxidoreductase subunit L
VVTAAAVAQGSAPGYLALLVVLPLVGAAVLLLSARRSDRWGHLLATAISATVFVLSVAAFLVLKGKAGEQRHLVQHLYSWVPVADFRVNLDFLLDPLSSAFTLLITGVGTLVHIYSIGYMEHDPDRRRFFAYLNLFLASMLILVLGSSYLVLYVGWELVGLSSYLLIGFWSYKPSAATAAKKAFVTNRVGDLGLSIGIMLMFATFGSLDFSKVFASVGGATHGTVTAICLLFVLGACGKSAQVPLHVWLPDAMEGPTPVSALIHAATMVTAGVYLVARSNPLFSQAPAARTVATVVGVVTVIVGGVIACAQDDIKKVLAYSTVSQIGYMMLGVGLGPAGYALGIFHLLTHGFFKALMFMGAGSVMHGLEDETDMRRMGGLIKSLPVTGWTFVVGWLAIIGLPPLAGFFSKDAILEASYDGHHYLLYAVALIGAGLTSFYMSRLVFMTFFGPSRVAKDVHPHESPKTMTVPLLVLAVGSAVAGLLLGIGKPRPIVRWLEPVLGKPAEASGSSISPLLLTVFALVVVGGGVATAYLRYLARPVPVTAPEVTHGPVLWARKKLYFDAAYESLLMRPGQYLARALVFLDGRGIDGAVNGAAALVGGGSGRLRRIQTGFVRSYALGILGGAVLLIAGLLLVRL